MSTRPRPRPRRAQPAPTASAVPSSDPSSSNTPPPPIVDIDNEDALFLRNRHRTAQAWKKLKQTVEAHESARQVVEISDDEDESDGTPRRRKKHKKSERDQTLPEWTRTKLAVNEIMLSSDEEEMSILQRVEKETPNGKRRQEQPSQQRDEHKRARSRSRSITPPPKIPEHAKEIALAAIRQIIYEDSRPSTPSEQPADDSVDNVNLAPELQSIARQIQSSTAERVREGSTVPDTGGPPILTINVKWVPHPKNPFAHQQAPWIFTVKRHESFHAMLEEVADAVEVMADHVMLSYDNKRVFPSATPNSIGIWAEGELEACDKITYEYLQENRRQRSMSVQPLDRYREPSRARSPSVVVEESEPEPGLAPETSPEPIVEEEEDEDKFRLTLRSGKTKDVTLTVRPSTTCEAIIKAFMKRTGLADQYPSAGATAGKKGKAKGTGGPWLMVDGDKLDPSSEIGEADLEDGDLVEVVGV